MHFLQREAAPNCLSNYQHGQHQWTSPTVAERTEIRTALEAMQGRRCAYCECDLPQDGQHGQHIEHFRQRSRYPQGTFDWDNLFLSCDREDSCGKHKDTCTYTPADLIKPDVEDPELFFRYGEDGTISVRQGLSPQQQHRAIETLRIFNIDAQWGPLRQMRSVVCNGYLETATAFQEMAQQYPAADWWPLLLQELASISQLPFCTAIKHTLTPA